MQETWEKVSPILIAYGINLLAALLIFIIGKWAAQFASRVTENILIRAKINKTLATFTRHIIYFGILVFVVIASLNKLGVETNSFIAIIGAAGLAVGFALQGSLSNFAAGVMLIIFQPFQVDDYVEAGGAVGTVQEIQIFNTVIEAADKKRVIVPNSKITADKITIYPAKP